jgi:hypothetical protein
MASNSESSSTVGRRLSRVPPPTGSLPQLPSDAELTTIGRFTTRFPDSAFLDMLALRASGGSSDADGLVARSRAGELDGTDGRDLAWFAFVLAAEPAGRATLDDVADLLGHALTAEPELNPRVRGLWLQVLLLTGRLGAGVTGPAQSEVEPDEWWAVTTDLLNPFDDGDAVSDPPVAPGAVQRWLTSLCTPFTDVGLSPLRLLDGTEAPFDRLTADALPPVGGPLVSVVIPVHDPGPSLVTSVRSVLAQSWADLEVLLCDDASASGHDLLEHCLALDPRVRLLRAARNGGAYSARNLGLAHAEGRFVTFQDADDFSHPQRIEREVGALAARPGAVGAVSRALRSTRDLRVTALGLRKVALNLSSLLVDRAQVVGRLGGFDTVRRSGDREFLERIRSAFGRDSVAMLREPMAILQLTPGSLSRGDMGFLRRHAARQAYATAAAGWHREIEHGRDSAYLRPGSRAPFPAPDYIATGSSSDDAGTVDLVLLANPTETAEWDVGAAIGALCDAGARVGLLEFDGPADTRIGPGLPGEETAARLRSGRARWVLPGERVRARVGMVHDPAAVLTMPGAALADAYVDHLVLCADRLGDYDARAAAERAATLSPGRVHWLPSDDAVARGLRDALPSASILPPAPWLVSSASPRPAAPLSRDAVVGLVPTRFVDREARTAWDRAFVPRDESTRVQCFGRGPGRRAGRPVTRVGPPETSWPGFLEQVDYLVAPPVDPPRLTHRIVDAWAHGTVVLAPEELRPHLGGRAAYVGALTVDECLARHRADPAAYAAIQHDALDWVRRHATADGLVATYTAVLDHLDAR